MSGRILVVDDEVQILRAVRTNLEARGFLVTTAQSGDEALRFIRDTVPDLVILDLELPGKSGLEVLRNLRTWTQVPVIIVSSRSGDPEKMVALDDGANDFLAKPFAMGDLIMRVRASLRPVDDKITTLTTSDFTLDLVQRTASRGGEAVELAPIEWKILDVLVNSEGRLVTDVALINDVWGNEQLGKEESLRRHVTQIRRKLEPEPARPRYFRTEPGIGYRLYASST
jgi:two-component system KDP operon response regulator KdpE